MPRRIIYFLLTAYAIAFAFGAMTAVRWPSIVMVMGWILADDLAGGLKDVDWRQLGIAHGGAYLLAAVCYYASAATMVARRRGAVLWYLMAMIASAPAILLVHFDPHWWHNPSAAEGALAGLAAGGLLLLLAVWELRWRAPRSPEEEAQPDAPRQAIICQPAPAEAPDMIVRPRRPPLFVPDIMVTRQRAAYAAYARRKAARQRQHPAEEEFAQD
jgi:hypothetical protein